MTKYLAGIIKLLKKYHQLDGVAFEGYRIKEYLITEKICYVKYFFCMETHKVYFDYRKLGYKRKAQIYNWKA